MATNTVLDILIVEDEMNSYLLAQKIKQEFSDSVKIHSNGHGLLDDIEPFKNLDIIIVDQNYVKEDMVHTLKEVRKESPNTEVIVLSRETEIRFAENIRDAGAYDYIGKDDNATDKILNDLKVFWSDRKLQKENVLQNSVIKRSPGVIEIIALSILALTELVVYVLAK